MMAVNDRYCIILHTFFISNTFMYNIRLKFGENVADAKQHFQAENEKDCPNWPKYGYFMLAFG